VKGLRYLEFDGGTDLLYAHVGTTYRKSTASAGSLSFSDSVTGLTGGVTIDSVHYNNVHYILNGVDRNRAVSSDGSVVFHGMLANTTAATANVSGGTGITLTTGNTLIYWIEERVKSGSTILRRSPESGPTKLTVTGPIANKAIIITRPAIVNSDATHWALFATATNDTFPSGAEISEVVVATTTITDTRTGTDPAIPGGSLYQTLAVSIASTTTQTARNGTPPIATTGDIFEDSVCLNDTSDSTLLWFSWPDEPHQYPATNFIRFETKEADEITLIKQVSQGLIVCLRDAIWRVAYLPRPEDAQFDRGRVKTQVEGAHGCVGGQAGATFSFGQGQRLAYVSRYGVLVTDGFVWDVLSGDLDWENTFNIAQLSSAVLVNNPRKYRLEMRAPAVGSSVNNVVYFFHYHPSQAKDSGAGLRAKVTGPHPMPASAATVMTLSGQKFVVTGASNGRVYLEDNGNDNGEGVAFPVTLQTGDIYPVSEGASARIHALYVHHAAGQPSQSMNGSITMITGGSADFSRPFSLSLAARDLSLVSDQGEAEAFQLELTNSDSLGNFRVNYFVMDFSSEGYAKDT